MNKALMTYLIWPVVKFLIAFIIVQVIVAAMNWIERRLLGLFQARLGPNRVGSELHVPWGLGQILADPVKFLLKEDIVPASADKWIFMGSPIPRSIGTPFRLPIIRAPARYWRSATGFRPTSSAPLAWDSMRFS